VLVTKLFAQVEIAESTNHETEELPWLRKIADNLSASFKSEADKVIYVTEFKSEADMIVFDTKFKSEAKPYSGIWFWTTFKSEADWKVYFTKFKSEANLKVYFTKFKSEAGMK
jgi:hypothetical protein